MSFHKNSLKIKVWIYFAIFSIAILLFLWFFQIAFLDSFYEWSKKSDLNETVDKVKKSYDKDDLEAILNATAFEKGVCIEVLQKGIPSFLSSSFNRGCMPEKTNNRYKYQQDFIESGLDKKEYTLTNPHLQNKMIVYGLKLDKQTYAFISASLQPLDATTKILSKQLVLVTILVLLLSFLIAYFISKKISQPIISLNESAKKMAKGNYHTTFFPNTDIAELDQLSETLNMASKELAKTEELRRDFMANVSHDLKTPLTMIRAYAEMARDLNQTDLEKRTKNLNIIIEETERLNGLVNDILELSKVQASIGKIKKTKFDLIKLINQILTRYDILKEKEHYEFIFKQEHPIYVYADQKRMEQVIYNLINNAIDYTGHDKKIFLNVEKLETTIKVSIRDTGKGIEKKDLPYIWDKYYKSEKNHQRNVVGTGLGLSIVKGILEEHQFSYGVTSEVGKGTTFYFEIPI